MAQLDGHGDCLARLAVLEALFAERTANDRTALTVASASIDRRLESMNEFRDQLREQASKFITRDEHNVLADVINRLATGPTRKEHDELKDQLQRTISELSNMKGRYATWAVAIGIMSVIVSMILTIWGHLPGNYFATIVH